MLPAKLDSKNLLIVSVKISNCDVFIMKIYKTFLFIILLLASTIFCLAQENSSQPQTKSEWTQVYDEKYDYSVLLPSNFLVDNEKIDDFLFFPNNFAMFPTFVDLDIKPNLIAHQKSVSIDLTVFTFPKSPKAKDYLWNFVNHLSKDRPYRDFTAGKFLGRIIPLDKDDHLGAYVIMAVKNRIIRILVTADKEDVETYKFFLNSIKLGDDAIFKFTPQEPATVTGKVSIASLKTSLEIDEALNRKIEKRDFKSFGTLDDLEIDKDLKFSRPLIILRQPMKQRYDDAAGTLFKGTLEFKVEFLSDGKIGDIRFVESEAPKMLVKKVFADIQEIRFLPAEIAGKKVNLVKVMIYEFDFN